MKGRTWIILILLAAMFSLGVVNLLVLPIDIKPDKTTNVLNVNQPSLLPVAVFYGDYVVDEASVKLEGVPAASWLYRYGYLLVKFDSQQVIAALGPVSNGDVIELTLTGNLVGGAAFTGYDDVVILKRGNR